MNSGARGKWITRLAVALLPFVLGACNGILSVESSISMGDVTIYRATVEPLWPIGQLEIAEPAQMAWSDNHFFLFDRDTFEIFVYDYQGELQERLQPMEAFPDFDYEQPRTVSWSYDEYSHALEYHDGKLYVLGLSQSSYLRYDFQNAQWQEIDLGTSLPDGRYRTFLRRHDGWFLVAGRYVYPHGFTDQYVYELNDDFSLYRHHDTRSIWANGYLEMDDRLWFYDYTRRTGSWKIKLADSSFDDFMDLDMPNPSDFAPNRIRLLRMRQDEGFVLLSDGQVYSIDLEFVVLP